MTDVRPARTGLTATPALGIVLALLVAGAVRMGGIGARFAAAYPLATVTAVVLFALFAVPFWLFVSELDFLEREPVRLRLVAFAWGALVATAVSIPGSAALENIAAKLASPSFAADWGAALAGPTVEEIAKTLGIVVIVLIAHSQVNSVLDGVVYGALVGLGFQIVENIVFAVGAVTLAGQGDDVQPVVATFLLRGFLAGVWSHALFGALAGVGIGYLVVHTDRPRRVRGSVALICVTGAWGFHVLWNSPLFSDGLGNGTAALLAVLLLKGLPPVLVILWLVRRAHDREADFYTGHLAALRDPTLITAGEIDTLRSGSRRSAARWNAGRARSSVRRLQRAQAGLAVDLSRGASTARRRDEIRRERAVLRELGHPEAVPGSFSWRKLASTAGLTALTVAVVWAALTALGGY